MIYALEALLKDETNIGIIVQDILSSIQLEHGGAFVLESDIYQNEKNVSRDNETMDIALLLDILKTADFCIFLSITFFDKKISAIRIESVVDFIKSSSMLAILIVDGRFLEIFAKDSKLEKKINSALQKHVVQSVEKINENQIVRTTFSVL